MKIDRAVLIGIAETETVDAGQAIQQDVEDEEQEGIPDGYLYASNGSLAVLFEMKRGAGRLHRPQLDAHKRRFTGINQVEVQEVIITWRQVLDFFIKQRGGNASEHRNNLLIDSFIQFCEYYYVGENSNEISLERIISRYDTHGFLQELDEFAKELCGKDPVNKGDSLDYRDDQVEKGCFFTIWFDRGFVIMKPKTMTSLYLDLLVAKTFGRNAVTSYDDKTQIGTNLTLSSDITSRRKTES